ncbi:hypothetical protein ECG_04087 [Echinococcus granulosus]|nr:hypothetical protein ECG_04087 [Echinococcus granulosus]
MGREDMKTMHLELGFTSCAPVIMMLLVALTEGQPIAHAMWGKTPQPTTTDVLLDGAATTMATATIAISDTTATATINDSDIATAHTTDRHSDSASTASTSAAKRPIFERLRETYRAEDYNYDFLREM